MKSKSQTEGKKDYTNEELERSEMISHIITKMFRDTFFSTYDWIVSLNKQQPIPVDIFKKWSEKTCKANDEMRKSLCDYYNLPELK